MTVTSRFATIDQREQPVQLGMVVAMTAASAQID